MCVRVLFNCFWFLGRHIVMHAMHIMPSSLAMFYARSMEPVLISLQRKKHETTGI